MAGVKDGGFTFVELMVVLFILSALAFFTVPYFAAPGGKDDSTGPEALSVLMASLRLKAVKDGKEYRLHLDGTSGRAWVTADKSSSGNEDDTPEADETERSFELKGLPISSVTVLNQEDPDPADTIIRFFSQGYSDAALVHLSGDEDDITLKLHPFLPKPETIPGHKSYHDCN